MMKFIIILSFLAVVVVARHTYHGDQVLRITSTRNEQLTTLHDLTEKFELDFWTDLKSSNIPVDIRVPARHVVAFKISLKRFRIDYQVFIEDVQMLIDNERTEHPQAKDLASFDYEVYHTFEEIQQWISDMANAYPNLATSDVVGTSFEGRTFNALTIGANSGNPQFVINCGIHAREWVTPATCMYSAMLLVTGYNNDETITSLVDSVNFVFIPSSNPDGYAYTWSNDRMWRKTRSTSSIPDCVGVDPNRNFDANHCGAGSSISPCSDTYCGPSAFSEKCTLAQKNFVESLSNPKMYVDVHSYSQLWMYPYGYTTSLPATFITLNEIAQNSVAAIQATHGMIYDFGPISITIYIASGGSVDYFYDTTHIPCTFATELRDTGKYGFLLPERLIKPTAEESFAAFLVMAQAIINGKCG